MTDETASMSQVLSDAICEATDKCLADNEAMALAHFTMVSYTRIDPETNETYKAWSLCMPKGSDVFTNTGLAKMALVAFEQEMSAALDPD